MAYSAVSQRAALPAARKVVDVTLRGEADAVRFALQCVPGIKGSQPEEVECRPLSGGLTNILYVVRHRTEQHSAVVRQYGEGTEAVIDRDSEAFWVDTFLDAYGRCNNGLAFRFLDGYTTAELDGYTSMWQSLAPAIADLHVGAMAASTNPDVESTGNFCLDTMLGRFVEAALDPKTLAAIPQTPQLARIVETLRADVAALREVVSALSPLLVEGFCHNDLNVTNTMLNATTGHVQFIDFEYTARNFLLYDVANHFNEHAGYYGEWHRCLDDEGRRQFVSCYLARLSGLSGGKGVTVVQDDDLSSVMAVIECLRLVSHIGWAAWSLPQAANSSIDFDYMGYATMRMDRYDATKDAALSGVAHLVAQVR